MDDPNTAILLEIRDLLRQTVQNQQQVLRVNEQASQLYQTLVRRQRLAMIIMVVLVVLTVLFASIVQR